ncbi:MAG: shikimate dehydrogenase [Clostridia bacterium]|nr:shikimate dehydrogenase [Clostridia bacterium]
MKFGLIGEKLGHSFSKPIHEAIGLYEYEICPIEREKLDDFLTRREFRGINVTIPYKRDVIPYLKEISPEAVLCDAVNTVVNRDGELYGYNTDLMGMKALLHKGGIAATGKKVLILGSGGTSGTALALCKSLGAERVHRVSRSGRDGCITYEEAYALTDTQVIINTTPCGMFPNADACPVELSRFPSLSGVADAIYNPLKTKFILEAEKRGIPAVGGLYMLVAQAVYAAAIFTDTPALVERIDPIYTSLLRQKQNIVLLGMPGCGKSTLGKALAKEMGKDFFDSDEEIETQTGRHPSVIIREDGEPVFRDREAEAIFALSARQGAVIATGGGAVLREENVENLRANGILIFLDAPLETLQATSDRPLSADPASLARRYEERYEKYRAAAHLHVPVSRDVEANLAAIKKELI